jgi:hypothetical protein
MFYPNWGTARKAFMHRIGLIGCVLASSIILTPSGASAVYDLSNDFSPTSNPNGAWTFGAKPSLDGPLSVFSIRGLNPFQYWQLVPNQEPTIYRNGTSNTIGSGQGVFPPGTVFLYSGTDGLSNGFGVVRFTVPSDASGEYHIEAAVRPVYDGSLQGDTDFHVVKNGTELFGRFLAPPEQSGYSNTLTLAAGDTIDFMIGRGQDNSGVSSGLKIQLTITSSPPPPPLVRYDLSDDFSPTSNPNGVWTFGAKPSLDGILSVFGVRGLNPFQYWQLVANQEPTIYRNGTSDTITLAGGQGVFPPGTVFLYSGTDGAANGYGVVRFTAPPGGSGEYHVETSVRPVYDGSLQGDTDFHVVKNGTELFGRFLAPPDQSAYSNTLTLVAGDTVDFVVGRGQDNRGASSGLKIHVTIEGPPPLPPPQEPRYVLSRDFSATENPSGPWSYGAKPSFGGPFSLFAIHGVVPDQTGRPFQYWQLVPLQEPTIFHNGTDGTNRTSGGQGTFPPGSTFLYSGTDGLSNQYGVVRFTTPPGGGGNYEVTANARPVYDGPLQGDTDFHVLKNGAELFGRFLAGAQTAEFRTILSLAAGDSVELVVGRGQDGSGFGSGLKIEAIIAPTTNSPPQPPQDCVPATPGLVAWWPLNGDAQESVNGSDGALGGHPIFGDGKVGQGLRFDGVDDHIRVPASAALDAGAGAGVTIELWLKPEDLNPPSALLEWSTITGPQPGLHFYTSVSSPGSLFANLTDVTGVAHHFNSPGGVLTAGVFQHVAFTYDRASGRARFYVNGANVAENTIGSLRLDTRPDLWIGQRPLNGPAYLFRGTMDEISLYNRALSAAEIQAIHQAGAAGKCSLPPHGNHAPVAKAEIAPVFVLWPNESSFLVIAANGIEAEVSLDGSQSSDPDNDALDFLWIENGQASPFAVGVHATNSFGLGEHAVTLVVSDGQDTGHDTVAFEVITLSDAVNELILFLTETELERRNKRPLLVTLNAAWESFEDGDLEAGVKRLRVFQQKVRAQVANSNPEAAAKLIAGAQQIIDAVEALPDEDHNPKGVHQAQ